MVADTEVLIEWGSLYEHRVLEYTLHAAKKIYADLEE